MTPSGGDRGEAGPSSAPDPAAVVRPGPDRAAVLAWSGAAVVVVVVAGLAAVGFQRLAPLWPTITDRWRVAVLEVVESDPSLPAVDPLPGSPPSERFVVTSDTDTIDDGKVSTNPSWIVRPQSRYPVQAQRAGIESGRVDLTCPVSAGGRIQSCWIVSETPEGAGFGQAALAGVVQSRLKPRTVDGEAVDTVISFTTRFELE